MKRLCSKALLSLMLIASSVCAAQSKSPAAPSRAPVKRSHGFLDYALGKINPSNKDYGRAASDARTELVDDTSDNLYFWSNVVSLTLLAVTFTALVLVLRTQDKREIIAANLICQVWNGRVIDRREIVRRTGMYNALVETKNAALTQAPSRTKEVRTDSLATERVIQKQAAQKMGVQSETAAPKLPSSRTERGETGGLPSSDAEQKTRLLEGQNQALRNSERNLRERLNQVSQDLEQERRRNQTLKGA